MLQPLISRLNTLAELSFTFDPAFQWWILGPAAVFVTILIVYLYSAQRTIAAKKIVAWLTAIRITLILLLAVLLLRPLLIWNSTRPTPETLWLVLDQSLSMAQKDKQASPVEQIRWADALGLMPPETRPAKHDRTAARIKALRDDLVHLQQQKHTGADEKETARLTQEHADAVKNWTANLNDVVTHVEKDAAFQAGDDAAIARDLRAANDQWSAAAGKGAEMPWDTVGTSLQTILDKVRKLADQTDTKFLADHGSDAPVKEALDKVSKMRRADIAYALLTGKSRDLPKSMLDLLEHQNTRVVSFANGQQIVSAGKGELPKAIKAGIEPTGTLTDLDDTLKYVADQIGPSERASVVVVSDGRSNDGGDPTDAAKALGTRGVRVFTLSLGTKEVARDAAVDSVEHPEWIYDQDTLTVSARIRLDNLVGTTPMVTFMRGDTVLRTQLLTPSGRQGITHEVTVVTFKDKPPEPGIYGYSIKVQEMPDEVTTLNNVQNFRVTVKEDKLNVILVQDQPRWEDRYIVNYLRRDRRVHLQQVLREPAALPGVTIENKIKAAPGNPGEDAQILPDTPEEWSAFDLIVLGDVPPDFLTDKQQENIAKAVTMRGSSLLVMAGPFNMPNKYNGKPLADLIPVKSESHWTLPEMERHRTGGFRLEIAPEGADNVLTRLDINDDTNARYKAALDAGEPIGYWHSEQTLAKPVARVLWRIKELNEKPTDDAADALAKARERALLAIMPAGYGRVIYLSGDSLWRMRYVYVPKVPATAAAAEIPEVGVNLSDRFYGQLVRWVAQNDLPAGGKFVRFGTSKPRYLYGDAVVVSVRLLNPNFTPLKDLKFKVVARNVVFKDAASGQVRGKEIVATADALPVAESPGMYQATLTGIKPGGIELSLQGDAVENLLNRDFLDRFRSNVDELYLRGENQQKAKKLFDTATAEIKSLDSSPDPADVKRRLTAILYKLRGDVSALLTAEQKTQIDKKLEAFEIQKLIQVDVLAGTDREMRNINADLAAMARMAQASGGLAADISAADIIAQHVPNLDLPITTTQTMGLFGDPENPYTKRAHWWFLAIFVVLITTEWVLRKAGGLV